jgi:hypothetical protein
MFSPLLEGVAAMKRTKRFTIRRIVLGLAVAAVLAPAAQAEPIGSYERDSQSTVEIPYLSGGVGVSHMDFDQASKATGKLSDEIPYLSNGVGETSIAPDDMGLAKPTNAGSPSVTGSSDGWDVGPAAVSGFAAVFVLLAAGSLLAVRHNRKTRLSPA